MEQKTNAATAAVGAAVLIIAGLIYWYWWNIKTPEITPTANPSAFEGVPTPEVAVPSANPLSEVLPAENPIEKTNPFRYENPFE